jgi:hypothetical protein
VRDGVVAPVLLPVAPDDTGEQRGVVRDVCPPHLVER